MRYIIIFLVGMCLGFAASRCSFRGVATLPPSEIVQVATEQVKEAFEVAEKAERKAVVARPQLVLAKEDVVAATRTRVEQGITYDMLPQAIVTELDAMQSLIHALSQQLDLEITRADAWRDAALASQALVEAMQIQHGEILKAEKRKSFTKGAGVGGLAVLLILLL